MRLCRQPSLRMDKWSPICALQQSEIAKVRAHEALIPHVKAEILSFSMEVQLSPSLGELTSV